MGTGLSKPRLQRMHDIMAGHVERGLAPGLITLMTQRSQYPAFSPVCQDFWTSAYQAIDD